MARKSVGSTTTPTPDEKLEVSKPIGEFEDLRADVLRAYEEGVSIEEAERLAAKFLYAQMKISDRLASSDLDARMKKNGYKTMRSTVYLDAVQGAEKKPTEAQLDALITTNKEVAATQNLYDQAEVHAEALQRYYDIFRDSHIYFRNLARGAYSG